MVHLYRVSDRNVDFLILKRKHCSESFQNRWICFWEGENIILKFKPKLHPSITLKASVVMWHIKFKVFLFSIQLPYYYFINKFFRSTRRSWHALLTLLNILGVHIRHSWITRWCNTFNVSGWVAYTRELK